MRKIPSPTKVLCLAFFVLSVSSDAEGVISTFDNDLEDWSKMHGGSISHEGLGGNPSGFLKWTCYDSGEFPSAVDVWLIAPPAYLGDWSKFSAETELRWDLIHIAPGPDPTGLSAAVFIYGPDAAASFWLRGDRMASSSWQTFAAPLSPEHWYVYRGSWDALVSNVTNLYVRVKGVRSDVPVLIIRGIDNVQITIPTRLMGDVNLDGYVDDDDLSILLASWNGSVAWGCSAADLSRDGEIDDDDLSLILAHWNAGTPPMDGGAIPEPATLSLLVLGGLALIRRRCK